MTKICLLNRSKVNENKMDTSNTRLFLNFLLDKKEKEAILLLPNVKDEIKIALKHPNLSSNGQKILEELNGIVGCLEGKNLNSAFTRAAGVKVTDSIENILKSASRNSQQPDPRVQPSQAQNNQDFSKSQRLREGHGQSNQDLSKTPYARRDPGQQNNYNMNGQNAGTYPEMHANRARIEPVNPEADLEYRSRMAGQRMRHNNPDIADLSDVNRPTKVAERFSELYDNEWTEAFEALVKSKSMKDEQKVIQLLLDIVETAYMFCKKEAEQQIDEMRDKILHILTGGMVQNPQTVPGSDTLLIQFRKSIANTAVDRVVQVFRDKKLPDIFNARKMDPPKKGRPVDVYTSKAVELTWWMCVQDPPIYMCMSDERIEPSAYPTLYRAYTRSGKIKDYSVWPALKLHQGGGVLVKGVMQFK